MIDWLASNLRDRAAYDTICDAERDAAPASAVVSCGNVFADLGLPDADALLAAADARIVAMCPICDADECGSALCEAKRRKAEQQAKAQAWAARTGLIGEP